MIKQITKKEIEQYDKNNQRWVFANQVLYDLCRDHIEHNDEHIIVAKIWLIGRSYAAALERRKNAEKDDLKDFYYDVAAPIIYKKGEELDKRIAKINRYGKELNDEKIKDILETHAFLTGLFRSITDDNKRSLASKYLHFHCPDYFFIYDGVASSKIGSFVRKDGELFDRIYMNGLDEVYCDFYLKALQILEYAKEMNIPLSPRDIDNILYYYNKNQDNKYK